MAKRNFSQNEIDIIRDQIVEMVCKGYSQTLIGKTLNISQQDVSYHWRQIKLKNAIERDAHLEAIRDRQDASLNLIKKKAWDIAEKSTCPDAICKALTVANRADDQINKVHHLYLIPPQFSLEEESYGATDEETRTACEQMFGEANEQEPRDYKDSPSLPSSLHDDGDESIPRTCSHRIDPPSPSSDQSNPLNIKASRRVINKETPHGKQTTPAKGFRKKSTPIDNFGPISSL